MSAHGFRSPDTHVCTVRLVTTTSPTRLVVLRGNSASGKSSVAAGLRKRFGRGIAVVGQDTLRRDVLHERDIPGGANVGHGAGTLRDRRELRQPAKDGFVVGTIVLGDRVGVLRAGAAVFDGAFERPESLSPLAVLAPIPEEEWKMSRASDGHGSAICRAHTFA